MSFNGSGSQTLSSSATLPSEQIENADGVLPGADNPLWVDVRCFNCNKLLFRAIDLTDEKNGIPRKMGYDIKCRRCKQINYRIVVT